jgi:hypothetical protein
MRRKPVIFIGPVGFGSTLEKVDLPQQRVSLRQAAPASATLETQAILEAAEASGKAPIQVDSEGGSRQKNRRPALSHRPLQLRLPATRPGQEHPSLAADWG